MPTALLLNAAARVFVDRGRLCCACPTRPADRILAATAATGWIAAVGLLVIGIAEGRRRPIAWALALTSFLFPGTRAIRSRIEGAGISILDPSTGELVRHPGGQRERRIPLSRIVTTARALDRLDGSRADLLPRLPCWLELVLDDGERVRIAQGGRHELVLVEDWLHAHGLPVGP